METKPSPRHKKVQSSSISKHMPLHLRIFPQSHSRWSVLKAPYFSVHAVIRITLSFSLPSLRKWPREVELTRIVGLHCSKNSVPFLRFDSFARLYHNDSSTILWKSTRGYMEWYDIYDICIGSFSSLMFIYDLLSCVVNVIAVFLSVLVFWFILCF